MIKKPSALRFLPFKSLVLISILAFQSAFGQSPLVLDPSLGNQGVVLNSVIENFEDMALQSDGKILLSGFNVNVNRSYNAARFLSNGLIDQSFASSGIWTRSTSDGFATPGVSVLSNGKVLVLGTGNIGDSDYNGFSNIYGLTALGQTDNAFGSNGRRQILFEPDSTILGNRIRSQPDGKLLLAGTFNKNVTEDSSSFIIYRFLANGQNDGSFGQNFGSTIISFTGVISILSDIEVLSDGKILLAGLGLNSSSGNGNTSFIMARLLPTGQLDPTFGTGGKVTFSLGALNQTEQMDLAVQADGKILCFTNHSSGISGARFLSNGVLDSNFGTSGKITINKQITFQVGKIGVVPLSNGKIFFAASRFDDSYKTLTYRLLSNGQRDGTFGTNGESLLSIPNTIRTDVSSLLLQADGKILLSGSAQDSNNENSGMIVRIPDQTVISNLGVSKGIESDFLVFPNPNTGKILNFKYLGDFQNQNLEISLTEISGKKVFEQFINGSEPNQSNQVSIPQIKAGIYWVSVQNNKKNNKVSKLISIQ